MMVCMRDEDDGEGEDDGVRDEGDGVRDEDAE